MSIRARSYVKVLLRVAEVFPYVTKERVLHKGISSMEVTKRGCLAASFFLQRNVRTGIIKLYMVKIRGKAGYKYVGISYRKSKREQSSNV